MLTALPASAVDPPTAIIDTPDPDSSWETCVVVPLSGAGSFDPDGGPLYYLWTLPNETVEGPNAQLVNYTNFTTPGDYNITLTVRDNESLEDNQTVAIHITPCNMDPVAVIAWPVNGSRFFTDEFINLSAAGSYDPDGVNLTYFWYVDGVQVASGATYPVRLGAGTHNLTLVVSDDRGGTASAAGSLFVEVNQPPRAEAPWVSRLTGFDGETFDFGVTYFDPNGQDAAEALLLLDGSPHAMAPTNASDPRTGRGYGVSLALAAGRHAFYFLVQDGNLTNLSAVVDGPDVFLNITRLSGDGLVVVETTAVPPATLTGEPASGTVPAAPPSLVAVSPAYFVNASGLVRLNYSVELNFQPGPDIDLSTVLLMRLLNDTWQPLVSDRDASANTVRIAGGPGDLPSVFRVFAARLSVPANVPPVLQITHRAAGGEYYPNHTVTFDANNSTDPEQAALLFAWRFSGPGVNTGWLPGPTAALTFPQPGLYAVELRADDGSGAMTFKNTTLEIRSRPAPVVNTLEEPATLAALAAGVGLSAGLAFWWRARRPKPKRQYEDQYHGLYKQKSMEEKEYAELFEKFAARGEGPEPPLAEPDPPAER